MMMEKEASIKTIKWVIHRIGTLFSAISYLPHVDPCFHPGVVPFLLSAFAFELVGIHYKECNRFPLDID